ncbi:MULTISPECIES: hypothetical protein [unclassified Rhizobium]|uniref:hypothetical protein n=1 Tax=unclassified Rhizobium TaxID=2613769 RepID=UPI00161C86E7|nr:MULTISPECIES: hypothetical protein [unclassified Rhizobium]MBB3289101.1 hypothetical protein [Rhizobium sp. BK252]MBB3403843.1 hypothetical protein [Rhizobium sp. BK289]MBB3416488.1 hypothetical protein [Rhizobium sp. BK284]MBB3484306.1 hypothetical protein [Rhizobium sp. BK347]
MLGSLIASLDNPQTAAALIGAVGMEGLATRVEKAAADEAMEPAAYLAAVVRSFMETASDDHFVQLVGIMNRADDPGFAAIRAILHKVLPEEGEA